MEAHAVETRTATVWLGDDGILRVVCKDGAEEGLEDARSNVEAGARLTAGRKVPLLVDMRRMKSLDREAREHYAGESAFRLVVAQALLGGSPATRVIGNFVLGLQLSRAPFPTRLFASEPEALEWLATFRRGADSPGFRP